MLGQLVLSADVFYICTASFPPAGGGPRAGDPPHRGTPGAPVPRPALLGRVPRSRRPRARRPVDA